MTTNFDTGVPSLDPSVIKASLREFLKGQSEFSSYNFEGSALSTILDLLTKNTHYLAFVANMLARESFLGRAQLRRNVVEHAQRLSYRPGSKTCSTIEVTVVITPASGTTVFPTFITMSPNTQFSGQYDTEVVHFTNQEEYTLYKNTDNTYSHSGVILKQGDLVNETFTVTSDSRFVISNPNIDVSTLRVTVQNSATDTNLVPFTEATSIVDVGPTSTVYFLYEDDDEKFRIEFGDDVLGKSLSIGNVVNVEYMAVNSDTIANGIDALTMISDIDGFVDAAVTPDSPAYGGSERETIEQIRRWAPLGWESQDRSVTESDYVVNLMRLFPQAKSAISWGGEDNDPPMYGSVYIAVNTKDGLPLVDNVKEAIKALLKKTNVGSITPIIVDPDYGDLDLSVSVAYDSTKSLGSMADEFNAVSLICVSYSADYLEDFNRNFINSDLVAKVKARPAVVSCDITTTLTKKVTVVEGIEGRYIVKFNNPITEGSVDGTGFAVLPNSTDTRLYDDGAGTLLIDRLDGGVRKVIVENAGTVDYTTGEVDVTFYPISVTDTDSTVSITVTPSDTNILAVQKDILRINSVGVTENTKLRR